MKDGLISIYLRYQFRHRRPERILPVRGQQLDEASDFLEVALAGADTARDQGDEFEVLEVKDGLSWGP